jgi:protein-S-isoprenylcysteine O-methyltransferase Ste14
MDAWTHAAILVTLGISVARTAWVLVGLLRTLLRSGGVARMHWDPAVLLTAPEMVLPALAAWWLLATGVASPPFGWGRAAGAFAGALLALAGLGLTLWSFRSLPSVGTGHYLLAGQGLVTSGAYGVVRNPIYTGAFLIWFGLAAAGGSAAILVLTVAYVIPAYVVYVRGEERMMQSRYGKDYEIYRRRVGAFLPRPRTRMSVGG